MSQAGKGLLAEKYQREMEEKFAEIASRMGLNPLQRKARAGPGPVKGAAEGVRAGAEAPEGGKKIAKKSAAARASQAAGRGASGPQSNAGATGSCATQAAAAAPERTKPNRQENEFLMNLMILRNTLHRNAPACRERARQAGKTVWRDIRLMTVLVDRIQDRMMTTVPAGRDEYYNAYVRHGHYELHLDGPVRVPRFVLIRDKRLAAICEAAMKGECVMCMREGSEIDKCPLRDGLLEAAPPSAVRKDGSFRKCEYRDAAGHLIVGDDVTI